MLKFKGKWLLSASAAVLLSVSLAGCRGFFVKPTLTSITVTPATPSLQIGTTQQMTATGTNNDGTTNSVTSGVTWTSSSPTLISVTAQGLIKGIANTTSAVTITATSGAISGSTTATVGQTQQAITITSSDGTSFSLTTSPAGTTFQLTATQNGSDVTSSVTLTSSNSNVVSVAQGGTATIVGVGTATITATNSTGSGTIQITVSS
jgi:uncharacterized protein YjdB